MIIMECNTLFKEIEKILNKYVESNEASRNAAKEVFNFLYDIPENKVIVVNENFRKKTDKNKIYYSFWEDDRWSPWSAVNKTNLK